MAENTETKAPAVAPPTIRMLGKPSRGSGRRRGRTLEAPIDYKNPAMLKNFVTDRGKMLPRRITGLSAKDQRAVAVAVRRARVIALLPFTVTGK